MRAAACWCAPSDVRVRVRTVCSCASAAGASAPRSAGHAPLRGGSHSAWCAERVPRAARQPRAAVLLSHAAGELERGRVPDGGAHGVLRAACPRPAVPRAPRLHERRLQGPPQRRGAQFCLWPCRHALCASLRFGAVLSGDRCVVQRQFGNADVTALGIVYSPSSICIRVPGGRFQRDNSRRIFYLQATCMATHCRPDGLHLSIRNVDGQGWSLYPCPAGQFVDLGAEAGYRAGVRALPLRSLPSACPAPGAVLPSRSWL